MTVDPDSLAERSESDTGGNDPLKRYDTIGDYLLAESESEVPKTQDAPEDSREKLRRIKNAKEGVDGE